MRADTLTPGLSCMGWLRAPICYVDDYLHRWFPYTFCEHWDAPIDVQKAWSPFICQLHSWMQDRYAARKWPELFVDDPVTRQRADDV